MARVRAVPYDKALAKYLLYMFKEGKVPEYDTVQIVGMLKHCEESGNQDGITTMKELMKYI